MSEFELEPAELKKLVNMARTKPLGFAYFPGKGEEGPVFTLHRRKKPDVMGKALKKESGQPKISFGTIRVEGKIMSLTCARVLPGMEKKLKKFLRSQKLTIDLKLLDEKGNELAG
jgi:hypothetical protein